MPDPTKTSCARGFALTIGLVALVAACGDASAVADPPSTLPPTETSSITAAPTTAAPTTTFPPTTTTPTTTTPTTTTPPTTAAPTTVPPTTTIPDPPRVLLVGDSTLLAIETYRTHAALTGFEPVLEVASCRTLGVPSCGPAPVPPNSVETITAATGPFDGVVIMAGYDEWWTSFPASVEAVIDAARVQGAEWILWLTYPEDVPYLLPDKRAANDSFIRNNETLRRFADDPAFDDLILAEWGAYSGLGTDWITGDGIHLNPIGAYGAADYLSRWIANLSQRPCPVPLVVDGPVESPCPEPDQLSATPDIEGLYLSTG